VLLVADAGLGTINGVRLSTDALSPLVGGRSAKNLGDGASARLIVALNRFDEEHDIHRRNRQWLTDRDGFELVTMPGGRSYLADLVMKDH
jgi:hypothetical protein